MKRRKNNDTSIIKYSFSLRIKYNFSLSVQSCLETDAGSNIP